MKSFNFLVSVFCFAMLLNKGAMAAPRDDHIAELKQLVDEIRAMSTTRLITRLVHFLCHKLCTTQEAVFIRP